MILARAVATIDRQSRVFIGIHVCGSRAVRAREVGCCDWGLPKFRRGEVDLVGL